MALNPGEWENKPLENTADEQLAEDALANYKLYRETYADQEVREIEDLEWQDPHNQWTKEARASRGPTAINGITIPARPCLSVPKIEQPIRLVLNQMQGAHLGVNIHPISEDADDDTAEVEQDLYRAIERDSNAAVARFWSYDRSTRAGRGWYRVNADYDEQSEDPFDLKITIDRIVYQGSVFIDPSSIQPDFSDAQWGGITGWYSMARFKRRWRDADMSNIDGSIAEEAFYKIVPDWVRTTKGDRPEAVQVAEYFYKTYEPEKIKLGKRERTVEKCKLWQCFLAPGGVNGLQVLEKNEWYGPDIPLIPSVGHELQPYDEKRVYFGMVRPARDSQQIFNYAASTMVERAALEPKAPFITGVAQIEGFESEWGQSNTRNFPMLPYNDRAPDGSFVPPPARADVSTNAMGPSILLLQNTDAFIQSATSTPDVSLGVRDSSYRSGKAEERLQSQSEASKTNYLDNFAQISMRYEAKVVLGMFKTIYDRPGRVARVVNEQGEIRQVMLNAPFVQGPDGKPIRIDKQGRPMRRNPDTGSWRAVEGVEPPKSKPKTYDFSKGFYGVSVTVGKSFPTRLAEGSEQIAQFMQADPQLAIILSPLYLKYQDWPGAKEAAELAKEFRNIQFPQLNKPKDGEEPTPEMLKAENQGLKGQMQQMGQQMQEMQKALETKQIEAQAKIEAIKVQAMADAQQVQVEAQAKMQQEQVSAQSNTQLEQIKAMLDVKLEEIQNQADLQLETLKQQFETQRLLMEQEFDARQAELERQQEDKNLVKQAAIAQDQAETAHAHEVENAERESEKETDS